jgi:hypothetical protein
MKKFNIGHITGLTVNAAEAMVDKAKKDIPAVTNTGKTGLKSWGNAVKDNYKTTRKGEVVIPTESTVKRITTMPVLETFVSEKAKRPTLKLINQEEGK